jgi:histone arginine demethylase JMJD6
MFESSLENNKEMLPILDHYTVPLYFKDDLLKFAGEEKRPPYRW